MKRLVATAAALLIGTSAFASDQFARSLGIEPGVYTDAELVELRAAMDADDEQRIRQLTRNHDGAVVSTQSYGTMSDASTQLARSVGLEPGVYTDEQMIRIRAAMDGEDNLVLRQLIREGGSEVLSTQSIGTTEGDAQLARILGVDSAEMSRAELAEAFQDY